VLRVGVRAGVVGSDSGWNAALRTRPHNEARRQRPQPWQEGGAHPATHLVKGLAADGAAGLRGVLRLHRGRRLSRRGRLLGSGGSVVWFGGRVGSDARAVGCHAPTPHPLLHPPRHARAHLLRERLLRLGRRHGAGDPVVDGDVPRAARRAAAALPLLAQEREVQEHIARARRRLRQRRDDALVQLLRGGGAGRAREMAAGSARVNRVAAIAAGARRGA
jgi:hypothetical protein